MVLRKYFYQYLSRHLAVPGKGPLGWYSLRYMERGNRNLELSCVKQLNIQPNHRILEVGFGPGIGLEAAYSRIKDGTGAVYGIDLSLECVRKASKKFETEIYQQKVDVCAGTVSLMPYKSSFFDGIYHTNCFFFWPDMPLACAELYRVLKPHGKMVTAMNSDRLKALKAKGGLQHANIDPVRYMAHLEANGFVNVRAEYLIDSKARAFQTYQVLHAEVGDKTVQRVVDLEYPASVNEDLSSPEELKSSIDQSERFNIGHLDQSASTSQSEHSNLGQTEKSPNKEDISKPIQEQVKQ